MKTRIIGCTLAALLLSACASTDEPVANRVPAHERVDAPTGSNIRTRPQQGPSEVRTMSREEMERNADRGAGMVPQTR
jgi:hypothetical protein